MAALTENVIREMCYILSHKWGKRVTYVISDCISGDIIQGDILIDGKESQFYWLISENELVDCDEEMIIGGEMFNKVMNHIISKN